MPDAPPFQPAPLGSFRLRAVFCADASGLSHREISRRAGLKSPQHFGFIYRGEIEEPRGAVVQGLAEAFGVRVGWLLFGEGDAPTAEAVRLHAEALQEPDGPTVDRSPEYAQDGEVSP